MSTPHLNSPRRGATVRPVAAAILAVALTALASIETPQRDAADCRSALAEGATNTRTVVAAIAAAVREFAGRGAASVAASVAWLDTPNGVAPAPISPRPVTDAWSTASTRRPLAERLLALPPPVA